jgi:hypothetical protein
VEAKDGLMMKTGGWNARGSRYPAGVPADIDAFNIRRLVV